HNLCTPISTIIYRTLKIQHTFTLIHFPYTTLFRSVIDGLLKNYLSRNLAARVLQAALDDVSVGFRPVVDHLTIRTLDIDRRAERSEEHTSELQSSCNLVCRLLVEKKN